jgi:uroporphyrin-III C-methyltransferase/precorrin-2 dehydrogenase/sirohydrochlorin ferrochelatase
VQATSIDELKQERAAPGGFVSLVGAGPGDPELLTRKAARRLEEADLVLYDALVSSETLKLAPRAQCFLVGKRAQRHSLMQQEIHALLIRAARRGKRVVRLKGGDPFVFGRGGEEALALAAAGIPFEVIPGVSAALAAPALAGIPITHREVAAAFVVVSGHAEGAYRPVLEGLAPHSATVVVIMGLRSRQALAECLQAAGWRARTPVAILLAASTPASEVWTGTLDGLGEAPIDVSAPGTIVVGDVVAIKARVAALNGAAYADVKAERG